MHQLRNFCNLSTLIPLSPFFKYLFKPNPGNLPVYVFLEDVFGLLSNCAFTDLTNSGNLLCKYFPGQSVLANILCLVNDPLGVPS
jgi:hypothetical protein